MEPAFLDAGQSVARPCLLLQFCFLSLFPLIKLQQNHHLLVFSSRHNAVSCGCYIPFFLLAICFPTLSVFRTLFQYHCLSDVVSEVIICLPIRCLIYMSIIFLFLYIPQSLPSWTMRSLKARFIPLASLTPNSQEMPNQCLYFCT